MIADPGTKRLPLRSSSSFHALIMAAPEKQAMNLQQISDRTSAQKGATRLSDPSHIKIWYNAELAEPTCCTKYQLCMAGFAFDNERSYMYLREGAMETNHVNKCCIKCLESCYQQPDCISITYFDKRPWVKYKGGDYFNMQSREKKVTFFLQEKQILLHLHHRYKSRYYHTHA